MLINPSFSLKTVTVDGIKLVCNGQEAKEIANKYPNAQISRYHKRRTSQPKHGPVVSISVSDYIKGM